MRRIVRLLALASLAALSLFAHAAEAKDNDFDRAAYSEAVGKAKSGDLTVDFRWLRQQNALGSASDNWNEEPQAAEALADAPETALKLAQTRIEANFLDLYAHAVADSALDKLGRTQEAQAEHALILAILSTVTDGKDGRSQEQAWNAVSVGEEYVALSLLGFRPGSQALVDEDGHTFDVMTVTDLETGDEVAIWFNVDFFFSKGLF